MKNKRLLISAIVIVLAIIIVAGIINSMNENKIIDENLETSNHKNDSLQSKNLENNIVKMTISILDENSQEGITYTEPVLIEDGDEISKIVNIINHAEIYPDSQFEAKYGVGGFFEGATELILYDINGNKYSIYAMDNFDHINIFYMSEVEDMSIKTLYKTSDSFEEKLKELYNAQEKNEIHQGPGNENLSKENNIVFSEEQVKKTLEEYLGLYASANCDYVLEYLTEKGKLKYDKTKDIVADNGEITTNVKFTDYKEIMLNYVTEEEFNRNWTSAIWFFEDNDGYIAKCEGGGAYPIFTIKNITSIGDLTYTANVSCQTDESDLTTSEDDYIFVVKEYKDRCVIDSLNKKNDI